MKEKPSVYDFQALLVELEGKFFNFANFSVILLFGVCGIVLAGRCAGDIVFFSS